MVTTKGSKPANGARFRGNDFVPLVRNEQPTMISRAALIRALGGDLPELDIETECRYTKDPDIDDYYYYWRRVGVANRVISIFPEACWQMEPEMYETENLDKETEFEQAWEKMNDELNILTHLQTADESSGIGQFGILLYGFNDRNAANPDQPVPGIRADGTRDTRFSAVELKYVRSFSQKHVKVTKVENNPSSPRNGLPLEYTITFADTESVADQSEQVDKKEVVVHWTRVLHLAENPVDSMFFAAPKLEKVFDECFNVRKILGASGQGYWQGGFPGISIETHPGVENPQLDVKATRQEAEKFMDRHQRFFLSEGLHLNPMPAEIADPKAHYETHLRDICITINVPMRQFMGSEEAKLASSQDQRTWNNRVMRRNRRYVTPSIIKAFLNRMFLVGALPKPKTLIIKWPDLNAPTDNDRATTAQKITEALVKYISGNVFLVMQPKEYLHIILGFPLPQVEAVLKASSGTIKKLMKLAEVAMQPKVTAAPGGGKSAAKTKKPTRAERTSTP